MAHALRKVYLHIVFACKYRLCAIAEEQREGLENFIRQKALGEGSYIDTIYAMPDHCHILLQLNPTQSFADTVRALKANSSKWMHQQARQKDFAWQIGYAAYSVSFSHLTKVRSYIRNQPKHHEEKSLGDELLDIAALAGEQLDEHEIRLWVSGI